MIFVFFAQVCRRTDSEFNYLRQLFRFNGIPHYELVLKDGSISKEELAYCHQLLSPEVCLLSVCYLRKVISDNRKAFISREYLSC